MADDDLCCFSNVKESFLGKAPKKSPLLLIMAVVVLLLMACSLYISSVCLKQVGIVAVSNPVIFDVVERHCRVPNVEPWEAPYVHYPEPKMYSRAECECNPVRYFAILSMQRSGSGWFETLLNSHINISSNGEIFSVKPRRRNVSTIVETLDRVYNLDWLSSASKNECTVAVGFKWMLNQGVMQHPEEVVEYFRTHGVSAIFLFRRNLLRRMISVLANEYDREAKLLNGTHKSHVHSPHEAEVLASYRPLINTTLLIRDLQQVENTTARALDYFKSTRHTVLYYEDIVKNRTASSEPFQQTRQDHTIHERDLQVTSVHNCLCLQKLYEVLDFLKAPRRELKSRQVKIHRGSLSTHVENWEEVQSALRGTRYEAFLDEDYR